MRSPRGCGREIQPPPPKQRARRILLDPAFDCGTSGIAIRRQEFQLRTRPSALDHAPAVAESVAIVNEQHAGSALPSGFLDLVSPAPVLGHGAAPKHLGVLAAV